VQKPMASKANALTRFKEEKKFFIRPDVNRFGD
jgi:hypothetical protein